MGGGGGIWKKGGRKVYRKQEKREWEVGSPIARWEELQHRDKCYAPSKVKPQDGGGHPLRKLTYRAVPWVGTLNIHGAPNYLTFRGKVTLGAEIWHSLVVQG